MRWFRQWVKVFWHPRWLRAVAAVNLAGAAYGYYWYWEQLSSTPWPWWPLVCDSPFSVTVLALALFLYAGKRPCFLLLVPAAAATAKYGLWAVAVIVQFWYLGGPVRPLEIMLLFSHLGMVVEGWLYGSQAVNRGSLLLALSWLCLNDAVDYCLGLHPYLFLPEQVWFARWVAYVTTITVIAGLAGSLAVKKAE